MQLYHWSINTPSGERFDLLTVAESIGRAREILSEHTRQAHPPECDDILSALQDNHPFIAQPEYPVVIY